MAEQAVEGLADRRKAGSIAGSHDVMVSLDAIAQRCAREVEAGTAVRVVVGRADLFDAEELVDRAFVLRVGRSGPAVADRRREPRRGITPGAPAAVTRPPRGV